MIDTLLQPGAQQIETPQLGGPAPYYNEEALMAAGLQVQNAAPWQPKVVQDRELISAAWPANYNHQTLPHEDKKTIGKIDRRNIPEDYAGKREETYRDKGKLELKIISQFPTLVVIGIRMTILQVERV